ncbi:MAG: hypothetical protein ACRDHD_10050 [Candidatus Limnocylindria bacterium]
MTLAFRRWPRPRVRAGGEQRTAAGVVRFEAVDAVERHELSAAEAQRAGFATLAELLAVLDRKAEGTIYRIRLSLAGPDPRIALREALPGRRELAEIRERLARLDRASRHGPWTRAVLELIRDRPAVPAAELAAAVGRERLPFKLDVRKLKELGLTVSLRPGYRLSPRGQAVVRRLAAGAGAQRRRTADRSHA